MLVSSEFVYLRMMQEDREDFTSSCIFCIILSLTAILPFLALLLCLSHFTLPSLATSFPGVPCLPPSLFPSSLHLTSTYSLLLLLFLPLLLPPLCQTNDPNWQTPYQILLGASNPVRELGREGRDGRYRKTRKGDR